LGGDLLSNGVEAGLAESALLLFVCERAELHLLYD
jgi:hypothetical protein